MQKEIRNIFGKQFTVQPLNVRRDLPKEKLATENHFKMRLPQIRNKFNAELEGQDYDAE